ncbi:hypothetical protein ACFSCX_13300 [Bacillus salitolerans]|uniref:Peptidase M10 metallopeptidase domain-containing protein n=1 Tax=Bacillus salitolerans TaxID=1437434 RepID=A0ABW4LTS3_9BACI
MSWTIRMNAPTFNSLDANLILAAVAHEFGHAVGLYDLYYSQNSGKLLYGKNTPGVSHASTPTYTDNLGAAQAAK